MFLLIAFKSRLGLIVNYKKSKALFKCSFKFSLSFRKFPPAYTHTHIQAHIHVGTMQIIFFNLTL